MQVELCDVSVAHRCVKYVKCDVQVELCDVQVELCDVQYLLRIGGSC